MIQTADRNGKWDFNGDGEEINWWPGWGSFYWVTRGYLWLMTDTTFDFDHWYQGHDDYYTGDPSDTYFDDPCHRDHALFGSNTGSSGRSAFSDTTDYATAAANTDDNVYFYEFDLYQLSQNGAASTYSSSNSLEP